MAQARTARDKQICITILRGGITVYQGTTPALNLIVEGVDLTDKTVFVTIRCGTYAITKSGDDLAVIFAEGNSTVIARLTQQETLRMTVPTATVQIRFVDKNGNADATSKATFSVNDVLYHAVISYEGSEG